MSGSRAITLTLSVKDAEKVREQLVQMGTAGEAALDRLDKAAQRAAAKGGLGKLNDETTKSTANMGQWRQAVQQGGYQLGDLVVQVQGGTSALTALSQQGSQFLGMFGPVGAVAGVVLSIGTIAASFLTTASNAEQAKVKGQEALDAMTKSAGQTAIALREINDLFLTASQRAANLANQQVTQARLHASTRLDQVTSGATELRRRLAEQESFLSDIRAPAGGNLYRAEDDASRNVEMKAVVDIKNLRSELAAADREANSLREGLARLEKGRFGAEEYGPTSTDPFGTSALRASFDPKYAAEQELAENRRKISLQLREGYINEAQAADLVTAATKKHDDALKSLDTSSKDAAKAARERAAADKAALGEVTALIREQNQQYDQEQDRQQRIFDASQQKIEGYKETLTYMEQEGNLLSSNADVRGRELALLKERQALQKEGVTDEEQMAERLKLVGEIYEKQLDFTQRKSSFDELARVGEQAFDRIGSAITEAFVNGKGSAVDFGNVTKAVLSEIAQAALRMAIVNPVLNSVFGGTRGTMSGLMGSTALSGGGSNLSITDSSGGVIGYVSQGAQAYSAYDKLTNFNPGKYMAPGYAYNTGWSGADSVLNTQVGSAGGTIGTYGAGALGIAGGAYSAYTGIQRGGVGGYTQAAGGAATAGLSAAAMAGLAVPVYGWIAAAALTILGALLPGQKPSDLTGTATFQTNDPDNPSIGGLTGDRFSQQTRDQAQSIGTELGKLATQIGQVTELGRSVETAYRVEVGARDGLNVFIGQDKMHGEMDEEGIKAVTNAFASRMLALAAEQTQDENIRQILGHSGNADPDATLANLDWYTNTWKVMQEPLEQTRSGLKTFEAQLEELKKPFQEVIDKSVSLGLATGELAKRQQEAVDYARGQVAQGYDQSMWQAQGRDYITTLRGIRENYETNSSLYRSVGRNPEDLYNQQAISALSQLSVDALRDVATNFAGWDDAMASLAQQMLANTEATQASTAALDASNRQQAEGNVTGVLGGITEFIQSMQLGDNSLLSPQAKLALANQQFSDIAGRASAGDYDALSRFTSAGQNLLSAGRDYYGSSAGYGDIQQRILAAAEGVTKVDADTLTSSAMSSIMRDSTKSMVDAIKELQTEVQLLRMERRALSGAS